MQLLILLGAAALSHAQAQHQQDEDAGALQDALAPEQLEQLMEHVRTQNQDPTKRYLIDLEHRSELLDSASREALDRWIRWQVDPGLHLPLRSTDNPAVVPRQNDGDFTLDSQDSSALPEACGSLPSLPEADRERLRSPQLARAIRATGAVLDETEQLVGSGWLAQDGLVGAFVTAAHVIADSELLIQYADGPRAADDVRWTVSFDGDLRADSVQRHAIVGLVLLDREADLAILAVSPRSIDGSSPLPRPLAIAQTSAVHPPERVAAIGFTGRAPTTGMGPEYALRTSCWYDPARNQRTLSFGHIALWLDMGGSPGFSHNAGAVSGASGGPVVDAMTGRAIGIHRGDDRLVAGEDRHDPSTILNEATEAAVLCSIAPTHCPDRETP